MMCSAWSKKNPQVSFPLNKRDPHRKQLYFENGVTLESPNEVLRTRLIDTLTRTLERMLSPISLQPNSEAGDWFLQTRLVLAEDADGHILGAITAMLMAACTGRLDLSIAGLFGAGKNHVRRQFYWWAC